MRHDITSSTPQTIRLQQTLYNSANPTRRWLHQNRRDWINTAIARYCENGNRLAVDIGAGIGVYLPNLSETYEHVLSLDNNPEILKWGHKTFTEPNINSISGDARALPVKDASADLVICSEVLEHIEENRQCLKEIHRILKPGGRLLLSMPQPWSLLEITARVVLTPLLLPLAQQIYREPVHPTGHINLISAKKTQDLLIKQGFTINEFFRSGLYLPLLAELFPTLAKTIAKKVDPIINKRFLSPLLWTQFYVATKPIKNKNGASEQQTDQRPNR